MRLQLRPALLYILLRLLKALDRRNNDAATFDPAGVKRILVISSTALGDSVMSTAAMVALRQRYPSAQIVALIHRAYVDLFRRMPELNGVVAYHGAWRCFWRTALALRKCDPDLALVLHGNEPQATPLAWLAGARFIFKLPNTSEFRFLLSNREPVLGWAELGHGMAQRLRVAALAGADIAGMRMRLPIKKSDGEHIARWLNDRGIAPSAALIGLQVGASSRGRMWPAENFAALAREAAAPGRAFLITGGPDEIAYCRTIAAAIGPTALVVAGEFGIDLLPALIARLSVLVTGDTGPLHVAVAVGTPCVALFAVSDPMTSGPAYDHDRHIVIYRPCSDRSLRSKTGDPSCIARIGVPEVAGALETLLARNATTHD